MRNATTTTIKDMSGLRVGRLSVVEQSLSDLGGRAQWLCHCSCGSFSVTTGDRLRRRVTLSCGCHAREIKGRATLRHGKSNSPEWVAWRAMKQRCYDPKFRAFPYYGGRGISVCERWRNSFDAFYADMGLKPSSAHSLDRIDVEGNYEVSNCRWATAVEQSANKRIVKKIEWRGRCQSVRQWADELSIEYDRLDDRLRKGWSVERAFSTPVARRP